MRAIVIASELAQRAREIKQGDARSGGLC